MFGDFSNEILSWIDSQKNQFRSTCTFVLKSTFRSRTELHTPT